MDFILSDKVKVRYSDGERRAFAALLRRKRRANTEEVVNAIYGSEPPFHGRQVTLGTLTSLMKKIDVNKEKFKICKGERLGPYPIEWTLEKR